MEKRKSAYPSEVAPTKKHHIQGNDKEGKLKQRYGIGAQLLSKMGYVSGKGLGADSSGIVNPIQTESASSPAFQRAGLGMLSMTQSINDDYSISSSDEDVKYSTQAKPVSFKKSEKIESMSLEKGGRKDVTGLLNELDLNSAIDYFNSDTPVLLTLKENINEMDDNTFFQRRSKLKLNLTEMSGTLNRLSLLDNEIPIVENDIYNIEEYVKVLEFLKSSTLSDFSDSLHMILKLPNDDTVDKLIANQIHRTLTQVAWDPLDPSGTILSSLTDMLENLRYRLETNKGFLNRTQTVLYELVFTKMENFWSTIDLSRGRESYDTVIQYLLNYESILKYIGCYDFILETYITPQLIKSVKAWNLTDSVDEDSPRHWLYEQNTIASEKMISAAKQLLFDKFYQYCLNWDYKTSTIPNSSDLIFIKNFLNEDDRIKNNCIRNFAKTFLKDYLEKYYDPLIELEEWNDVKENIDEADSIAAVKTFRSYVNLFDASEYDLLLKFIFNELNKVLFQWLLYADDESKGASIFWFNWFINSTFLDPLPNEKEILEIKNTFKFLNEWKLSNTINPIHNEDFNVERSLENIYGVDMVSDDDRKEPIYNMTNIPMRRIRPTFREIVEEFCEVHGFFIRKISNKYAHLKYGKDSSLLVPIFEVSNTINDKRMNIAMKDDILWAEKEEGKYLPTFLYKMTHLLI
ncbi:similar to Saccharomyces cerevisiae YLR424W SPP382 Essential protein that forms a dimer with Ntr2p [Maudiozyma barnettii]|uniref:Similar to Saccharomyces cerevisiae YLR424W SPP382 Essential protein that forms a dimer with Ntr2p n=1 Tax=Maudiozyma barnettii TaxID=61262 RepID=A0A8H2ZK22_9SACH|nr:mRNA splicing protein SPP382 [Kazachstania barnettii]CAB4256533.1 similar to Saccharomyces cerevisiae YLR424W SPP382 Essential protein that forms a dimer with Ntr2p [Kazachstania barnettii]CAD1785136.1 similar to Saccharomyces cerevisiae YLR424W SPP382 Essential protein that forms a dimer with Ntr2p [Kazachstania barnettii]